MRQLQELQFEPSCPKDNWVQIPYEIQRGTFATRAVTLAFEVPPDFPTTPPSGPHLSPRLRPNNTAERHPDRVADSGMGDGWMYLSRPFQGWMARKGVAGYLAFVGRLLETL